MFDEALRRTDHPAIRRSGAATWRRQVVATRIDRETRRALLIDWLSAPELGLQGIEPIQTRNAGICFGSFCALLDDETAQGAFVFDEAAQQVHLFPGYCAVRQTLQERLGTPASCGSGKLQESQPQKVGVSRRQG